MKTIQYFLNLVYYATWCANERQDKVLYNIMHFILKPFINSSMKDKKEFFKGVNDVRNTHSSMFYSLVGNMVFIWIFFAFGIITSVASVLFNIRYTYNDNDILFHVVFGLVVVSSFLIYYFAIKKDDVFLKYFSHFEGKVTRSQKIWALFVFYIGIPLLGIVFYIFYYLSD
jgi:hypothetical protein